jgi:hypothetical protein
LAPLSDHVDIIITQDSLGVPRAGFGIPMILSYSAPFVPRIRSYGSLAEIAEDFPDTDSPEYLSAVAMLSQSPHPRVVKIGRGANVPTQRYSVTVSAVRNSHAYQLRVQGQGVPSTLVEYESDASATSGEIASGLVAALNLVAGKNFTAAGATSPFTITGDAAGDWFSIEVVEPEDLAAEQDHADPGVQADLAAIALEDNDWYGLHTLFNSKAMVGQAAAWIQTAKKLYVFDTNVTEAITTAIGSADDVLEDVADLEYTRTAGVWYHSPAKMISAAVYGLMLPKEPGSATYKFKSFVGVEATVLTSSQRSNLRARNANFYEEVAGKNIFMNGTRADGDFIDVTVGDDWLEDDMSKSVFEVLGGADKVPFTDPGVTVIENAMRGSLRRAVEKGILAEEPAPDVSVPRVADVSADNKAIRRLPSMKFSGNRAGAIHEVSPISGVVSL